MKSLYAGQLERFKAVGKFNGKEKGTKKTHTNLIDFCADTVFFPDTPFLQLLKNSHRTQ